MRISDWSSDVCSSDLLDVGGIGDQPIARHQGRQTGKDRQHRVKSDTGRNGGKIVLRNLVLYAQQDIAPPACRDLSRPGGKSPAPVLPFRPWQIGRASCRERVGPYVLILGVAVSLTK